jgi:hypothetical protein
MKVTPLILTEDQLDLLAYALTCARRQQDERAVKYEAEKRTAPAEGCRSRARRIGELLQMVDTAPEVQIEETR